MAPVCRSRCWGMKLLHGRAVSVAVTQPLACCSTLRYQQNFQPQMKVPRPAWVEACGTSKEDGCFCEVSSTVVGRSCCGKGQAMLSVRPVLTALPALSTTARSRLGSLTSPTSIAARFAVEPLHAWQVFWIVKHVGNGQHKPLQAQVPASTDPGENLL